MSFKTLAKHAQEEGIKQETDSLGSGGLFDSGLVNFTVTSAFQQEAKSGAYALVLHAKSDTGRDYRETLWVTTGKEKGQKPYSVNAEGEKKYLPGYLLANALCRLTIDKELFEVDTEKKIVKLYNYETKTDVATEVDMVTDLIGQKFIAGVLRQTVTKQKKGDDGTYYDTDETRDENVIDKIFHAEMRMTVVELEAGSTEPKFINDWDAKHTGQTRNRVRSGDKTPFQKTGSGAAPAGKKSLFNKNPAPSNP